MQPGAIMNLSRQSGFQLVTLILAVLIGNSLAAQTVEWFLTDSLHPWVDKGTVQTTQTIPNGTTIVNIYPDSLKQEILGFGGCFNEKGWQAMSVLSQAGRDSIIKALFDSSGCAFNYCRTPIGASDYALNLYTLDDTAGDYALDHFSIRRDSLCLMKYIKAAQTYSPDLQVWGVPWTIPGWMMSTGFCTPQMYTSLALYFEKYVLAYRQQGINVVAVHIGNEPCGGGGGVNTVYTAQQMRDFIRDYLGPKFTQDNVKAEIWQGDLNCSYSPYMSSVLDDPEAAKYVTGIGAQYAGEPDIGKVRQYHPEKKVIQTETNCENGGNTWGQNGFWLMKYMHDDFSNGANAYMQWNMVLDASGKNFTSGWVQNAMITVDTVAKSVKYNYQYYCVKHFSHFIQRGARLCKVTGVPGSHMMLAFVNPSGDVVVVDRILGAGSIALKVGANAAIVNMTDGVHTFVFKNSLGVTSNASARQLKYSTPACSQVFKIVGDRVVLPGAIVSQAMTVDMYDIRGMLIQRIAAGSSDAMVIEKSIKARQAVIVKVR
jgi:glucosylceramidase